MPWRIRPRRTTQNSTLQEGNAGCAEINLAQESKGRKGSRYEQKASVECLDDPAQEQNEAPAGSCPDHWNRANGFCCLCPVLLLRSDEWATRHNTPGRRQEVGSVATNPLWMLVPKRHEECAKSSRVIGSSGRGGWRRPTNNRAVSQNAYKGIE